MKAVLLGPQLNAVGLCCFQRLVEYDREDDAREGVALAASIASLAEVLESGLGLGGAHVDTVFLTGDRVVSEHKGAQRGVGWGQGHGPSGYHVRFRVPRSLRNSHTLPSTSNLWEIHM